MKLASFMQLPRQQTQQLNQLAFTNPVLKTSVTGLVWRILPWQLGPLRTAAQNPKYAVKNCTRIMPGTATVVLTPSRAKDGLDQLPLFVCQFPTSGHSDLRRCLEQLQFRKKQCR